MRDREEQDAKKKMGEDMSEAGQRRQPQKETKGGSGMNEPDNQGGRGGMRDEMGRDE